MAKAAVVQALESEAQQPLDSVTKSVEIPAGARLDEGQAARAGHWYVIPG
jgi:hypothetical protein